ncbi:glucose-methanol-choline oxidoreductase-like protein [Leptodontidium sp. MPI-SDFR-AT-0119]|nr:glucose-methanol-choline oxidoreductase-like protein [Leptodontidium sp. MPI-SDFR-AT-0119]
MSSQYDFIVVGAGPSGCAVATRLAKSPSKPSVLLVEAGGDNKDAAYLVPADRFNLAFAQPNLNWGYKTAPQTHLQGQEIDYSRGKGLGGSTAINFSCWVIGADEDFDEWARKVGDDAWKWTNVKERFKKIERYHVEIPKEHQKYISPKAEDHGTSGPLDLSYADIWEKGLGDVFVAAEELGLGVNPDVNSGNPIGMGMGATCAYQGERTTASSYLKDAPSNLTLALNSTVAKVLIDGKKATGIKTVEGKEFFAKNDVILSGGALNSPQLLMLSGIGPADELKKHGIPVVHESPEVGKNLQDHGFSTVTLLQKPGTNDRMTFETDAEAVAAARAQHTKDKTGMMNSLYGSVPMGWFKSDAVYASEEFKALDKYTQDHLKKPTVPAFEMTTHTPPLFVGDYQLQPTDSYLTALAFVMNPQSYGEVTLNSADPLDAPKADPRLVSHPYDRRVLIEGVRKLMDYLEAPVFKKSTVKMIGCPKSRSDEDIWEHCTGNMFSSWHMCSTTRMGKKDDKGAVVDTDFRVRGVKNLMIVDLSVLPLLPNNHTQSTAYLVGETAAEKIIAEYGL